ncbi:MAG: IMP cyclohydrolase [Clostridia bacterium]|nr:IMP cyclohydrolase [Clostridia bacterium]
MKMINLENYLKNNTYPGRGVLVGKTEENIVLAYFIMGRSVNSRNRVFVPFEEGIRTKAFDESKLSNPSLVIYAPVRVINGHTIVTNGDQTDTVYDFMKEGKSFEEALRTREFEPDPPNWTPRISAVVDNKTGAFKMSILKSDEGNDAQCLRYFYEYMAPVNGEGRIIHTYEQDGNPIPTFVGEPRKVAVNDDMEGFTNMLWNSLNEDNKVSLFVRYISLRDGSEKTTIINKNK